MRVVIQRVSKASVRIEETVEKHIGPGMMILLGIERGDTPADTEWLAGKTARLRIFPDEKGVMNRSAEESRAEVLVISQFTLLASTRKGNRPSYTQSAESATAIPLYDDFVNQLRLRLKRPVLTGEFGAHMEVSLTNDGPVTILIDSRRRE
jgi:D-tyrosyl-tRNA(Tyr) deacylase